MKKVDEYMACIETNNEQVEELIKRVQIESYNQAVEDCISTIDPWKDDKASLLKLKKK